MIFFFLEKNCFEGVYLLFVFSEAPAFSYISMCLYMYYRCIDLYYLFCFIYYILSYLSYVKKENGNYPLFHAASLRTEFGQLRQQKARIKSLTITKYSKIYRNTSYQ